MFSTFLGGSGNDYAEALVLDAANNSYLIGDTLSSDFPTVNAYDDTHNGGFDGFLAKHLDPTSDLDGDGLLNGWEYQMGLNASSNDDSTKDLDGDGLNNSKIQSLTDDCSLSFQINRNDLKIDYKMLIKLVHIFIQYSILIFINGDKKRGSFNC